MLYQHHARNFSEPVQAADPSILSREDPLMLSLRPLQLEFDERYAKWSRTARQLDCMNGGSCTDECIFGDYVLLATRKHSFWDFEPPVLSWKEILDKPPVNRWKEILKESVKQPDETPLSQADPFAGNRRKDIEEIWQRPEYNVLFGYIGQERDEARLRRTMQARK